MGLLEPFKKKRKPAGKAEIEKFTKQAHVLNDYYIMRDSIEIIQETVYPETFFKRYKMAIQKAEAVINSENKELSKYASKALSELRNDKTQTFNDFLDRCDDSGKLPFVKKEIIAHKAEMPKESYEFFESLLELHSDENDDDEYIFCSIVFGEGGRSYYYLSDNEDVHCGDYVTVPVGKYDEEKTGRVIKIEIFKGNTTPFPIDSLKYIIDIQ